MEPPTAPATKPAGYPGGLCRVDPVMDKKRIPEPRSPGPAGPPPETFTGGTASPRSADPNGSWSRTGGMDRVDSCRSGPMSRRGGRELPPDRHGEPLHRASAVRDGQTRRTPDHPPPLSGAQVASAVLQWTGSKAPGSNFSEVEGRLVRLPPRPKGRHDPRTPVHEPAGRRGPADQSGVPRNRRSPSRVRRSPGARKL